MKKNVNYFLCLLLALSVLSCNERANDGKETEKKEVNMSDTRRNSTDTSSYINDSAKRANQH